MENLKKVRLGNGYSQNSLAEKIKVSRSTIAMWETGKSQPDNESLKTLSKVLNVSVDYLLGNKQTGVNGEILDTTKGPWLPVLGTVKAGIPIEAIENISDYEQIPHEMAAQGEFFALEISGDSMEPRISNGDIVIFRKQPCVETGDIAVVIINGCDATIKRIKKSPKGIMLIPGNPAYEPLYYTNKEIEELPVVILGKVVELRGKFK
jgi:repressor LexA